MVCSDGKAGAGLYGTPPPVFRMQNPCFHEVTDRVALQYIHNKEVPCKIFQAKELAADLEEIEEKAPEYYCATKCRNYLQTSVPFANPDSTCTPFFLQVALKLAI